MILVIVYVGAVAVLFLFVVMMLDVNFSQLREGFQRYNTGRCLGGPGAVRRTDAGAGWLAVRASRVGTAAVRHEPRG